MGYSVRAQLSFGVLFRDSKLDYTPWDEDFDGDEEEWWLSVNNFINPHEYPFSEDGSLYKEGFGDKDPRIDEYFDCRRNWLLANPLPFDIVRYGWHEHGHDYILCVKGMSVSGDRSDPKLLDLNSSLFSSGSDREISEFKNSLQLYGFFDATPEPKWYLCSFVI